MDRTILDALDTLSTMEKQLAFTAYLDDIETDERNVQGRLLDHNGEVLMETLPHDLLAFRDAIDTVLSALGQE
jgi:hypothetical protein